MRTSATVPNSSPRRCAAAPAHLNDECGDELRHADGESRKVNSKANWTSLGETIDAAGGWWDAGDYLKFVQTTSYAVDLQLIGVRDFPAQMGSSSGDSNFTEEARFGVEWLLRMWNDNTRTLYYQVGIGAGNAATAQRPRHLAPATGRRHLRRQRPQLRASSATGPVFRAGPPGVAGEPEPRRTRRRRLRASASRCSTTRRPELADRCLLAAEHIFELREHRSAGQPPDRRSRSASTRRRNGGTTSSSGATELARSRWPRAGSCPDGLPPHASPASTSNRRRTGRSAYISRSGTEGEGLNLYDVSGLAHYELVRGPARSR